MEVIPWKLFHGLVIFFSSRHARNVVMSIFHDIVMFYKKNMKYRINHLLHSSWNVAMLFHS